MPEEDMFLAKIFNKHKFQVIEGWAKFQLTSSTMRAGLLSEAELRRQSGEFVEEFKDAVQEGSIDNINTSSWQNVRELLTGFSKSRAELGFSASETATFIFSFKQPLLQIISSDKEMSAEQITEAMWKATVLVDQLGLYTVEQYQKTRESIIARQQRELLELSTPVVQLWPGIISLPLIGTLDSERTQMVMENLLQKISDTNSQIAIIDITGVSTVDTLVAQHLLKTVSAARLMGAECYISGISSEIAQTMVHLGVQLGDIVTKSSLADAFALAMRRMGLTVMQVKQ